MAAFMYIYDGMNLTGSKYQVDHDIEDLRNIPHKLGNWNDETSSFEVVSGNWTVFEDVGYRGQSVNLKEGQKGNCVDYRIPENWISSIKISGQ